MVRFWKNLRRIQLRRLKSLEYHLLQGRMRKNPKDKMKNLLAQVRTYMPSILFPQCLAKIKLDEQFKFFFKMIKKLYVNIPFIEALQQMSTYCKFLKKILANKRKLKITKL